MTNCRKPSAQFLSALALAMTIALAGCSTTALPPGKSIINTSNENPPMPTGQTIATPPPAPGGFAWSNQTLTAIGDGDAPEGMPAAQSELTAQNAARIHALNNLKTQVKALPVGTDQTVGSIMDTYITIRHAVEQEIASAHATGTTPLSKGRYQAQVQLPMTNVANILQKYQITTDQELPETGETQANVPHMI